MRIKERQQKEKDSRKESYRHYALLMILVAILGIFSLHGKKSKQVDSEQEQYAEMQETLLPEEKEIDSVEQKVDVKEEKEEINYSKLIRERLAGYDCYIMKPPTTKSSLGGYLIDFDEGIMTNYWLSYKKGDPHTLSSWRIESFAIRGNLESGWYMVDYPEAKYRLSEDNYVSITGSSSTKKYYFHDDTEELIKRFDEIIAKKDPQKLYEMLTP